MIQQKFYCLSQQYKQALCILLVFFISLSSLMAQNRSIDSLLTLLKKDKSDTNKVNNSNKLSLQYIQIGLYETALHYGNFGLELAQKLNFKKGIANSCNMIGTIYWNQGDYPKAFDCYFKALKIEEELGNNSGIANSYNKIGTIYWNQGEYPKALNYYFKALKIAEVIGDKKGIALYLGNIGLVYWCQTDYPKALDYYYKALKMSRELGDKIGIGRNVGNIGIIYDEQANYPKALDYYLEALKINEGLGDKNGIAANTGNIGALYIITGRYKEAEEFLKRAIDIYESMGVLSDKMGLEGFLSELYETTGQYNLALIHYKKAIAIKDTVFSQENKKQLVRKEMNYEFDKREAFTKAENEKQQAVAEEKNRRQEIMTWSVACGLLLVLLFAGFIFRSLRITRKQKQIIEIKKTETEQQKKIIEEKNKDITDSIRYAKRIQDALMGEQGHVSMHLPEHFILFMPKDIVSGDFHWGVEKQGHWYFAAVDCTGHGVPGAVMSMLGISFLNDIVSSEQLLMPSEVLNRLRDKVVKELRQTGEAGGSKDGMDISLCRLNLKSNELQWAGAYNPLNLFRNGQLEEVKADKQPIGYHPENHPFTNHEIQLQKGDSIYLYSDGYADQFGGPKGKKFKYKQLEDLIITKSHLSMDDQKEILKKRFTAWKGSLEQIDDVCVFGVRI